MYVCFLIFESTCIFKMCMTWLAPSSMSYKEKVLLNKKLMRQQFSGILPIMDATAIEETSLLTISKFNILVYRWSIGHTLPHPLEYLLCTLKLCCCNGIVTSYVNVYFNYCSFSESHLVPIIKEFNWPTACFHYAALIVLIF